MRFDAVTSEDPIRFSANDLNLFRYVGNDPWKTDPFGLAELVEFQLGEGITVNSTAPLRVKLSEFQTFQKLLQDVEALKNVSKIEAAIVNKIRRDKFLNCLAEAGAGGFPGDLGPSDVITLIVCLLKAFLP